MRSQGRHCPQSWRDRQEDTEKLTTYWSRNPGVRTPTVTSPGVEKPALQLTNCWRLSVGTSQSKNLLGNQLQGPHTFVSFTSRCCTTSSQQLLEETFPVFWQREEESILKYAWPFCSSLQGLFYQSLKYLGEGNAQMQLPLTFHMWGGKYAPPDPFSYAILWKQG